MAGKKSRQVETRMLSEYLKKNYSRHTFISKQPLGKVSEELMAQEGYKRALGITRPYRPEIDAVVILPRHLLLIETKVWNIINGLAKLPLYAELVPHTPELQQYLPRGIITELVVAWTNPNLEIMAQKAGVRIRLFCPDWLQEIIDGMHKYWTKEYQEERQKKLRMREYFGVD